MTSLTKTGINVAPSRWFSAVLRINEGGCAVLPVRRGLRQVLPLRGTWDGRDDGGRALARGVYFVRVNYARSGFEKSGKLVVLR